MLLAATVELKGGLWTVASMMLVAGEVGDGARGEFRFFRRGKRKMVVVVDTSWVVVVVLYAIRSPELASDRDDSERRFIGMASDELDSSPYAGGTVLLLSFFLLLLLTSC